MKETLSGNGEGKVSITKRDSTHLALLRQLLVSSRYNLAATKQKHFNDSVYNLTQNQLHHTKRSIYKHIYCINGSTLGQSWWTICTAVTSNRYHHTVWWNTNSMIILELFTFEQYETRMPRCWNTLSVPPCNFLFSYGQAGHRREKHAFAVDRCSSKVRMDAADINRLVLYSGNASPSFK